MSDPEEDQEAEQHRSWLWGFGRPPADPPTPRPVHRLELVVRLINKFWF